MTLRSLALVVFASVALTAGAVLAPAGSACGLAARPVCASLEYSGFIARAMARRIQYAADGREGALLYALTSSPVLGIDLRPLQQFGKWWMEQTGAAVMARHRYL